MGVPGFFSWVLKNCNNNVVVKFNNKLHKVSELYIDSNSIIHNVSHNIINNKDSDDIIIKKTIKQLDSIISFVNPSDIVFISIDGVAPCAKIIQQRHRRYMNVYLKNQLKKIQQKHKLPTNTWDNLNITPGTIFMDKLHKSLLDYQKLFNSSHSCKMIYSSVYEFGEGEHKIINYIKNNDINESKIRCIYGLDADLIFLSLSCNCSNITLLRENIIVSNNQQTDIIYHIVNINQLKQDIYNICKEYDNELLYSQQLINDIIFICYLFGNDFIPQSQIIDIHNDMNQLINKYINIKKMFNGDYLINVDNINITFFIEYIKILSEYEVLLYNSGEYKKRLINFNNKNKRTLEVKTGYDKDKFMLENFIYNYIILPDNYDDYKYETYTYYTNTKCNHQELINNICKNYLDGLMWTFNYYFPTYKITNLWSYQYPFSPFLTDIYKFIISNDYNINIFAEENKKYQDIINQNIKITPEQQLLCVIPYNELNNINSNLYNRIRYINEYKLISPYKFKILKYNKQQLYKCKPNIPFINFNNIIKLHI